MNGQSPAEAFVDYFRGLPTSLKPSLLVFVLLYTHQIELADTQTLSGEFDEIISGYLAGPPSLRQVGAILCARGIVDFVFRKWISEGQATERAAKRAVLEYPDNPKFRELLLSLPLHSRHLQRAFEEWGVLRAGALADSAIDAYLNEIMLRSAAAIRNIAADTP